MYPTSSGKTIVVLTFFVAAMLSSPAAAFGQELVWAKRAGGTVGSGGSRIAVDNSGNSYVTGFFQSTATFGPGEANETTLTGPAIGTFFVAKFDPSGALVWARGLAGSSQSGGVGIGVDSAGNSYVTGYFFGTATFGPGEANETALVVAGGHDIFIAKYDTNGALVWAKRAGGTVADEPHSIALDSAGNSYVTGHFGGFGGTATFGPGEANETTLVVAGGHDIFVAKYDINGALVWAKRAGGSNSETGHGVAVDSTGNSYVTGFFQSTATFGPGEGNQTTLAVAGSHDIFVAKYDPSGALAWARRAGGGSLDQGWRIAVDSTGNSYATGFFQGTATFGPGEANQTILFSPGGEEIFVAKYDPTGALVWAKRAGGTSGDQALGIAVDGTGKSYVAGLFQDTATFGAGEANQTTLVSAGGTDIFLAKYDIDGTLVWARRAGGSDADGGTNAIDGTGNSYVTGNFAGTATFGPGEPNETMLTSDGGQAIPAMFVAKYSGEPANQAPVANAGADQVVSCTSVSGTAVMLDGSGSSDPDGDELTYTWTGPFPEGGGTATGVSPTVTLPLGTATVTLVVNDGQVDSAPDIVDVTVAVGVVGLQPPLLPLVPEGESVLLPDKAFRQGRTLPLKLQLLCGGMALTDADVAAPRIVGLVRESDAILLETIDPDAGEANDSGLLFRYSEPNWVYNLNTKALSAGTYVITIELPDGLRYTAAFVLK
jgi:hypothetical protein